MFFRDNKVYTEKTFSAVEAMIEDATLWTRCLEGCLDRRMKTPFVNWDAAPDLAQATWEWPDRGHWEVLNTGSITIPPGEVYVTP